MAYLTALGEILHEEHFRILSLICNLEHRVLDQQGQHPIDPSNPEERAQLHAMIVALDQIIGHNAFEEEVLFPMISAGGGGELTSLLTEEHTSIGPLAKQVRTIAACILERGNNPERWQAFRTVALELVAQMMMHLQMEEIAVVQQLRSYLDSDTDRQLALRHLAERPPTRIKLPSLTPA